MAKKNLDWLFPSKWKGLWYFIWDDDSLISWIVNILLAFVIIKFLLYPGMGLIMATDYPIVAVVSESMEHDGNFDMWWSSSAICGSQYCSQSQYYFNYGIEVDEFKDFKFSNGFNKGDLMILRGKEPKDIKIGDILVFDGNRQDPIIHRVIKKWYQEDEYHFQTKGDHNSDSYAQILETDISQDDVVGVAVGRVPLLGWIKIMFVSIVS